MHRTRPIILILLYNTALVLSGLSAEDDGNLFTEPREMDEVGPFIGDILRPKQIQISRTTTIISTGFISLISVFAVWFCRRKETEAEEAEEPEEPFSTDERQLGIASPFSNSHGHRTDTMGDSYLPDMRDEESGNRIISSSRGAKRVSSLRTIDTGRGGSSSSAGHKLSLDKIDEES